MPLWLLHWGMCRVSKLGAMSKIKSCKIWSDCKKVTVVFHGFVSDQSCVSYQTLCKQNVMLITWISNIGAILQHLFFDISTNLLTLGM